MPLPRRRERTTQKRTTKLLGKEQSHPQLQLARNGLRTSSPCLPPKTRKHGPTLKSLRPSRPTVIQRAEAEPQPIAEGKHQSQRATNANGKLKVINHSPNHPRNRIAPQQHPQIQRQNHRGTQTRTNLTQPATQRTKKNSLPTHQRTNR